MSFVSWAFVALFAIVFAARLTIGRRKIEPAYVGVLVVASTVFYTWHVPGQWYDIGDREQLEEADRVFSQS